MEHKSLLVLCGVLAQFFIFFCYDIPAALNDNIDFGDNENKQAKITLLYSAYAAPNIIAPICLNYFLPNYFSKIQLIIFMVVMAFTGQTFFTIGIFNMSTYVMLFDRLILGIGSESFAVVQHSILVAYFKGKNPTIAIGISKGVMKVATLFTFLITPPIKKHVNTISSCFASLLMLSVSVFLCVLLLLKKDANLDWTEDFIASENPGPNCTTTHKLVDTHGSSHGSSNHHSKTKRIKMRYDIPLIIISLIGFFVSLAQSPFYSIAPLMFQQQFRIGHIDSSRAISFMEIASFVHILLISPVIFLYGMKLVFLVMGTTFLTGIHLLMLFRLVGLRPIIILSGMGSPLVSCYWSCVPLSVSSKALPAAFSVLFSIHNFAYCISPMFVAHLATIDPLYFLIEGFFSLFFGISLIFSILLLIYDINQGNILNCPEKIK